MAENYSLPPDLVRGQEFAQAPSSLWHLPPDVWGLIWSKVTGAGIKVAVLDTGYTPHPDLPTAISERSFISGEAVHDRNGHGSHCSGTSVGRNGIGVAPGADLMIGKVLSNAGGGGSDGIAAGIRWAVDEGADVISLSLGGGGYYQPTVDALRHAEEQGSIVVAAAGNAGYNGANTIGRPGKYQETLCIGAYRRDGSIARFSSGGRELDVACPGEDIVSTKHTGSGYVSMSGTSMATPFMAGLMALIVELQRREGHASFTGLDALREFLKNYTDDGGAPGDDVRFGMGIPKSQNIVASLAADDVGSMSV